MLFACCFVVDVVADLNRWLLWRCCCGFGALLTCLFVDFGYFGFGGLSWFVGLGFGCLVLVWFVLICVCVID